MKIEVLISTMNLENNVDLIKKMNIKGKSVTINQYSGQSQLYNVEESDNRLYNYNEKGLSRSRNNAIKQSIGDVCVIADDDMIYYDNYIKIIEDAYKKYDDADIIAFYIENEDENRRKRKMKERKIEYLHSMKLQSVQLTFKKKSITDNKIFFNEKYGAGTDLYMGEENIFLFDCLKKKLKIYYIPKTIARLKKGKSSWFDGYNKRYLFVRGKTYKEMFGNILGIAMSIQFVIRHYKLFRGNVKFLKALQIIIEGVIYKDNDLYTNEKKL